MAKLFANIGDPDQTAHSAAPDLGLHCLPITFLGVSGLQWLITTFYLFFQMMIYYNIFEFYSPANPVKVLLSWSVNLLTFFLADLVL